MVREVVHYGMIVAGQEAESDSGQRFEVEYPYTREIWATVPRGTQADVDRAVRAAKDCFLSEGWRRMTATQRGELLFALADKIEGAAAELAELETLGNGKLLRETAAQVAGLPRFLRYYGGLADKIAGRTVASPRGELFNYTRREPYGVVAAVTPWNSPLPIQLWKIAPAIAAGNTVVVKPSEVAPVTAVVLARLAIEAGFPAGALNVVTGFGDIGEALVNHPGVNKVAFTGGVATGRRVARAAAGNVVSSLLELGGKSPNIVFADANLDNALAGTIKAIFSASGQTCVAGSRLYLQSEIHADFLGRLVESSKRIKLGDPLDLASEMAPIASEGHLNNILRHIETAVQAGAELLAGGKVRQDLPGGLFLEPTILTGVTPQMAICREEVFGPVLAVLGFDDEEEVVRLANDSEFGLAAGVWTSDIARAMRMIDRLQAGVVWVNTFREVTQTVPFGGVKHSGIGREHGVEAMDEYLQTKSVWIDYGPGITDPFALS